MESNINLQYINYQKDIEKFWEKRDEYFVKDIIPESESGDKLSKEDIDWFFSKEYRDHIMKLFKREIDPLYIVFINEDKDNIGFVTYVIYNSEDGKCFILDFCIYRQYRNKGVGKRTYDLLEKDFIDKGATYIDLNVSNTNNERFWAANGFLKTNIKDEHNNYIYRKKLS
jgi:ribosomal protein S18 acetylase RimI-like enzyme